MLQGAGDAVVQQLADEHVRATTGVQWRWTRECTFPIGKVMAVSEQDAVNIPVREIQSTSIAKSGTMFPIGNIA
jgi:hypothetical protein